jgi:hypothetical protein
MFIQIKDKENLIRDVNSKAILNVDGEELKNYYARRELALKQKEEKENLESKVNKLEEDITDIKGMLRELVQMRNSNGN